MLRTFLILFALLSGSAQAEFQVIAHERIFDEQIAEIRVKVTDIGESADPLALEVSVLCIDRRLNRNSERPVWIYPVDRTICDWGGQHYDKPSKSLSLQISKTKLMVGDSPCRALPYKLWISARSVSVGIRRSHKLL